MHLPTTRRLTDQRGFTLVELLVVILIIAILAAIALPSFLNQRGKAQDSQAKAQVRTAQTAIEIWFHEDDTYVGADKAKLQALEPALKDSDVTLEEPVVTKDTYELAVTSKTGNVFTLSKAAAGDVSRSCKTEGKDGCPRDGQW